MFWVNFNSHFEVDQIHGGKTCVCQHVNVIVLDLR